MNLPKESGPHDGGQEDWTMDGFFGDFGKVAPLLVLADALSRVTNISPSAIVLPADVLPGVTKAYGLPVIRADDGVNDGLMGLVYEPPND